MHEHCDQTRRCDECDKPETEVELGWYHETTIVKNIPLDNAHPFVTMDHVLCGPCAVEQKQTYSPDLRPGRPCCGVM